MFVKKTRSLALVAIISSQVIAASPVVGPEHTRNLRTLEMAPMLFEYHRQTTGSDRQFFTYPRRDAEFRKHFVETESNAILYYDNANGVGIAGHGFDDDSVRAPRIGIATSVVGGIDYRGGEALGDTIWPGIDGGIYLRGFADSVEFMLDARIYDEGHSAKSPKSIPPTKRELDFRP